MMCKIRISRMILKCTLCLLLAFELSGCGISERLTNGRHEYGGGKPEHFVTTKEVGRDFDRTCLLAPYLLPLVLIEFPIALATDLVSLPFELLIDMSSEAKGNSDKRFWETYFAEGTSLSTHEEGRNHLSDAGRSVITDHLCSKPLPKHQLIDLIYIGLG